MLTLPKINGAAGLMLRQIAAFLSGPGKIEALQQAQASLDVKMTALRESAQHYWDKHEEKDDERFKEVGDRFNAHEVMEAKRHGEVMGDVREIKGYLKGQGQSRAPAGPADPE